MEPAKTGLLLAAGRRSIAPKRFNRVLQGDHQSADSSPCPRPAERTLLHTERRVHARRNVSSGVSVRLEPSNVGFLADASEGGVSLSAGMPLVLHQSLRMNFQLEDGSSIDAAGEVVWVNDSRHSGGLRFVEIEAGSHERIRAWVAALPPAIEDVEEEAPVMERLSETAAPISQEQGLPEHPAATRSGMPEAGVAGTSALRWPSAISPAGPAIGATPVADQTIRQTDVTANSLPALRADVLRLKKEKEEAEEEAERNRRRRSVQRGVAGVIAVTALAAAIVLVRSQRARISAVVTELKQSATDFLGNPENDQAQKPSAQGGKAGVHKGRRAAGAPSRAGEPRVSSGSSELMSDQAATRPAAPVYHVTYRGKEWNVISRTGTIVAFQTPTGNLAGDRNVIPSQATAAQTGPGGGQASGPAGNPASSESTSITQARVGESDNSNLVPIYSPLDLRNRELAEESVILFVIVKEDGTVREVHLLSKPSELASAIAKAVRLWRYQPVLRNGKPVEVGVRITIGITPTAESGR